MDTVGEMVEGRRRSNHFVSSGANRSARATRGHRPDYVLVIVSLLLAVIGLVLIYSLGPALAALDKIDSNYFVEKQFLAVGLATVAFIVASKVPLDTWRKLSKPLLALAVIATIVALVLPVNTNYPAHRWVRLGGLSFQSIELVKFALVLWLADLFVRRRPQSSDPRTSGRLLKPLVIIVLLVGLVVVGLQKDYGSAVVIMAMLFALALTTGVPLKKIGIIVVIVAIIGTIAIAAVPYRRARVATFLNPTQNCQTASGWQACQAMISVGSGGMFGLGLGRSVQAYGYLPQAANDSIFAIYAEKFGFIGCIILLTIFLGLFSRIKHSAERASDEYSRLVATGILAWVAVEALINIGGMIGVIPMKGITLPFVSYGGTSMIFTGAAIGLVFQISRYGSLGSPRVSTSEEGRFDRSNDRSRHGRPRYTASRNR